MRTIKLLKYTLLVILVATLVESVSAQRWKLRRYEVGTGLGMTQVFGDIGGTADAKNWFGLKDIKFDETRMAFPLYVRYRLDPVYALKFNTTVGFGNGDDHDSRNNRFEIGRGRSYKTTLFEFSAQGEYYFVAEERKFKSAAMFNRRGMINNYMSISAYGFLGLGAVYANAREIIVPGPDPEEKDDVRGSTIGAVIPFGIGAKYIISDRWLVNAELGYRYSFSDYLEGYSNLQNSKFNDVYYFLNLTVGYRLETTRRGLPGFLDKEYRRARPSGRTPTLKNKPRSKKQALE